MLININEMGVRGIASAASLLSAGRYSFYPSLSMRFIEGGDEPKVEPVVKAETGDKPPEDVPPVGTPDAVGNQEAEGLKAGIAAERSKRQAAEAEVQSLKDQLALQQNQVPQQEVQQQGSLYASVAKHLGIDPVYATPEEQGQIFEAMMQVQAGQQSEQSFINSHPDYAEVVGVLGPGGQFQYAPPLFRALKANPVLANALKNSPNKAVLAYEIASKDSQYLAEKAEKAKSDDVKAAEKAEANINAANKQLSVSAVKSGGGTLDKAAQIANMSDEEFAAHNQRIMDKAL